MAQQQPSCMTRLCARYGISRKTGYKWRRRYAAGGEEALADQTRRPHRSPRCVPAAVAAVVVALREQHPAWGGRKLRRRLQDLCYSAVPAASTCTQILRRGQLLGKEPPRPQSFVRFQRARPNELWQMDFKGHFPTQSGARCHPLTVLDDHSRFNVVLRPCADEQGERVKDVLTDAFARFGLPEAILCDNGPPWGHGEQTSPHTTLSVWLLRLGVEVLHGRPYHPQTQGKDERFHRTLERELLCRHTWSDLKHCGRLFPPYREHYNCERPHDALQGDTPIRHYASSPRSLPNTLSPLEYPSDFTLREVYANGLIFFRNQSWYVGRAFASLTVGLRPSPQADGQWEVFFGQHRIGHLDFRLPTKSKHQARSIYLPTN
jgi:transposase InsO family protein